MASREKYIFNMLFGAFHDTSRTVFFLAIQSTYSSSCPGNMQIANRSNSLDQSFSGFQILKDVDSNDFC